MRPTSHGGRALTHVRKASGIGLILLTVLSAPAPARGGGPSTRLADAAQQRDVDAVRQLLRQRATPVDAPQADGATALHWAAHWGDESLVRMLLQAGANANARNDHGVPPISLAASRGHVAVVEQLLSARANPNTTVRRGETPLMAAARAGSLESVKALIARGADVNAREGWNGQTALMWAAAEGHAEVLGLLLDRGADWRAQSNSGATALLFAARRGASAAVRVLIRHGADVNARRPDGATPLLVAIVNGHEDLVDELLAAGADPNVEGGATDVTRPGTRAKPMELTFRQLTESEADRESRRPGNIWGTPLHAAVHMGNPEKSDIHFAVKLDRIRVITALLAHGADVNARIRTEEPRWIGERYRRHLAGATPFLLAAKAADVEVMRLLLEHGADPAIGTFVGTTPLMAAAGIAWAASQDRATERDALAAVEWLAGLGADVHAVSDVGETAVHGAAYRGANTIVEYLAARGARLDVADKNGLTPLLVAEGVEYGNGFAAQPQTAALLHRLLGRDRTGEPR